MEEEEEQEKEARRVLMGGERERGEVLMGVGFKRTEMRAEEETDGEMRQECL